MHDFSVNVFNGASCRGSFQGVVMNFGFKQVPALVAGVVLAGAAQAQVNLVTDGQFLAAPNPGGYTTYSTGATFGGWTVGSGSVDLIGSYWQAPPEGGRSVDLDGGTRGSIFQALNLSAGSYLLSFYLSGNPDGPGPVKSVSVSVGDQSDVVFSHSVPHTKSAMAYEFHTLSFTTAGATTLTFTGADTINAYGAAIGGVSVTAVPEPASYALGLAGLAVLGFVGRRRAS